jgi:hypothetical protein
VRKSANEDLRLVLELALRGPLTLPAQPEPYKLDADTRAGLEPAVGQSECPVCGALPHQRRRNLAFPPAFRADSPERTAARDREDRRLRAARWPGFTAHSRALLPATS